METKNYDKEERFDPATVEALKLRYADILRLLGEDPAREGLLKTPERVAKAMAFLTKGYDENPLDIIRSAMFREEYRQMVLVKDIELYSLCEHHMLPFYGKGPCGLYSQRLHHGSFESGPRGGVLRPPLAGAGAADGADPRLHSGGPQPDGRGRGDRGQPHVHADARHREGSSRPPPRRLSRASSCRASGPARSS